MHTHDTVMWAILTVNATADSARRPVTSIVADVPRRRADASLCGLLPGLTRSSMRAFDPNDAWKQIEDERITTGCWCRRCCNSCSAGTTRNDTDLRRCAG